MELTENERKGGRVLARAVDLMTADKTLTFGQAIATAERDVGEDLDEQTRAHATVALFGIIASGKIPGAADA